MKNILVFLVAGLSIGCTPEQRESISTTGYVPIYASVESLLTHSVEQPKAITRAGKIYAFGNYLFQNDIGNGIHIINNANRQNPQKVAFIHLPMSTEVAVKGNFLYSNNYRDIVVFDISNPASPRLIKRLSNVFPPENQRYPPFNNCVFECPDSSKGVVIAWEKQQQDNYKCRR